MINLNQKYDRADFVDFLQNTFLDDYTRDVRPVTTRGFSAIGKAVSLGRSESLDLQVFEFEYSGSAKKRVTLTKEAFQIMKQSATFNALAVFYGQDSDDWRLSFLTASPQKTEKGKVTLAYSNPRRYSFFLGSSAKVNTPTKFLISRGKITSFDDLKSRFSIEVVNKEFYKEISKAFTKLSNGLIKLPSTKEKSQINLEFAVRLIGRIIFCWFLREKKGNSTHALMPKVLLSLEAVNKNEDYYHQILEPIFFEVLNKPTQSRRNEFTKEPFSFVPYLNGGLFTPQDDDFYRRTNGDIQSQFHNTLVIPDSWLKEFFATLETYNFTIDENISFDEELSIDPEMLGRIFENLLAEINPETGESARKATGSYYTPRTIVNYMVDESLFLYLKQKAGIEENKLKAVISYDLADDEQYPLTQEEKEKVIYALESLKLLDPACGSGAFPIGALQKIVFVLQQIDPDGQLWFKRQLVRTPPELRRVIEREFEHQNFDYIRKLGIIRENIYGIDIQPIATEIARLRCFLTLIVDERIQDDLENRGIEPLPNLDFKFVTANSLIGLPTSQNTNQMGLFEDDQGITELKELRDMYFTATGVEREQLKLQFVQAQNRMFQRMIEEGRKGYADLTTRLSSWDPFSHKVSNWFDPEWMFGIKEDFDIVIANPPYLRVQELKETDKTLYKVQFSSAVGSFDLYILFIEKGVSLLNSNGILSFITPDKWINGDLGKGLRKIVGGYMKKLISFKHFQVFNASTYSSLLWILNEPQDKMIYAELNKDLPSNSDLGEWLDNLKQSNFSIINNSTLGEAAWIFTNNEASRIFQKLRSQSKKMSDVFSKIFQGIASSKDSVYFLSNCCAEEHFVLGYSEALSKRVKLEEGFVKPLLMGEDVHRYTNLSSTNTVLFPYSVYDDKGDVMTPEYIKENYPLAWNYLAECEDLIKDREKGRLAKEKEWYRYIYPKNLALYNKPKLLCPYLSTKSQFAYDEKGEFYTNTKVYGFIKKSDALEDYKFLLAILNSSITWFYIKNVSAVFRGGYYVYAPMYINDFPLPTVSIENQQPLIKLVDEIVEAKNGVAKDKVHVIEKQIDQMVYKLYGLTNDEIKIVEESV